MENFSEFDEQDLHGEVYAIQEDGKYTFKVRYFKLVKEEDIDVGAKEASDMLRPDMEYLLALNEKIEDTLAVLLEEQGLEEGLTLGEGFVGEPENE